MKFAGRYIRFGEGGVGWFDWLSFIMAVNNYKGDDLKYDNIKTTTISQSESTVKTMVDKIVEYLVGVLRVDVDAATVNSLTATIQATFTNLKHNSSSGFLDFDTSSSGSNSSWEYRIYFVLPDPNHADSFYSLVTTIVLEANVTTKTEWWGLVSHTSRNFSATIAAMQLVVKKGFRDPNPDLASFSNVLMGFSMAAEQPGFNTEQLGFDLVVGSVQK